MKKTMSIIAIFASVVMTFTACSSKSNYAEYNYAAETTQAAYDINDYAYDTESTGEYLETKDISNINTTNQPNPEFTSKIIRDARISLESLDVKKSYDDFIAFVNKNGGYEFSMDMSANERYTSINATIKINPTKLDDAISYASECGTILSSNISSDDITSEYYDTKIRLENKYKNLEKYYGYLENATTMEEIIPLQNQIDYITTDIEAFEGRIRMWDALVNESTISISISQKNDPNFEEEVEEFDWKSMTGEKMLRHMSNGFKKTCNGLFSILQWLVIVLVTISPMLIIAGIVIFIVLMVYKKKKSAKKVIKTENPETPLENKDNIDSNQ